MSKRRLQKRNKIVSSFTNLMAVTIMLIIIAGLFMSYSLAEHSIRTNYTGALYCWTAIFATIGTSASIVLGKIVDKKNAENNDNAKGITYAAAEAKGFNKEDAPMI